MATRSLFRIALWVSAPALCALVFASCGGGDSGVTDGSGGETAGPAGPVTGTGGGTTSSSTGSSMGGMGGSMTGCTSDADCTSDPAAPVCETSTGKCVGCLPTNDTCASGQYCDPTTFLCTVGCTDDADCDSGNGLICDTQTHKCVGCVIDTDCPQGSICISDVCVPGCSGTQPCQAGFTCCGQTCFDTGLDVNHCGDCATICDPLLTPNAPPICVNGQCGMGACNPPYADCDGKIDTGCEQNTLQDGDCQCNPGDSQSCYGGAPGTDGVGPCKAGTQICNPDGLGWGTCDNQVLPTSEICANGVDEDCDAIIDNGSDQDNDGFTACPSDGDCDDTDPLVNPGAFEFLNNGVDDDCDAATSDTVAVPACSTVQKFAGVVGDDIAKAIDLCQFTTVNPPKSQKKWGVITAEQKMSSGANPSATTLSNMQNFMHAVMQNYGTAVTPKKGPTMGALSTGKMRDQNDAGFVNGDGAANTFAIPNACPPVYYNANGGLPSSTGCNGACPTADNCYDGSDVKLTVRVPTNAQSFSYQFKFYSYEFPEWVCDIYNDFYLALLQTTSPGIPADTNISFDGLGNPFSVNNGFFDVCQPTGCHTCPAGIAELAGTGMSPNLGGGSKWLTTDAPIVGGETMVLEFITFDVGDWYWDSNVLIDNFTWNISPATVGTHE